MSTPASVLAAMPSPGTDAPLSALDIFPVQPFTGAPYNAKAPSQSWLDPTATAGVLKTYGYYDLMSGTPVWTLFQADGTALNIPGPQGQPMYPAYSPAATPATWVSGTGGVTPANPAELSTMAQAVEIALAWGLTPAAIALDTGDPRGVFTPNGETRLPLWIAYGTVPGLGVDVGSALVAMNQYGVGAPITWNLPSGPEQQPTAVPVGTPPFNYPPGNPAGPVPQTGLPAGYTFVETFGAWSIMPTASVPTPAAASGGLTPAQATQLQQTLDGVNTLLAAFGKPAAS